MSGHGGSEPFVTVDCFPTSLSHYREGWAVVAVDVIRATTTAVTAVSRGRRCFPVADIAQARSLAASLTTPLLAGEHDGARPDGFEENNSPAAFAVRTDTHRPLVLLSTSGTRLLQDVGPGHTRYAACLRNITATVEHVAQHHARVAVIGAGTHGEFREEDALGCARIAEGLVQAGFRTDRRTARLLARWHGEPVDAIVRSKSAVYLHRTHQLADLDFVLSHVDDLAEWFAVKDRELLAGQELRCGVA